MCEEMNSKAPLLAKHKKEGDFLKQKTEHYQKLVTGMMVCIVQVKLHYEFIIISTCIQEQLKQVGYKPSLSHETLLQLEKVCLQIVTVVHTHYFELYACLQKIVCHCVASCRK